MSNRNTSLSAKEHNMPKAITSSQIIKDLNISRSTFYYLLNNNIISLPTTSSGRYIWDQHTITKLKEVVAEKCSRDNTLLQPQCKVTTINNRRYLGNKYKLLDFIKSVVTSECSEINTVADIFAGTGAVASAFLDKKIISNDLLYFNYICHIAWFSPEKYNYSKVVKYINYYNSSNVTEDNYMSINFADTFFSLSECRKIGYIREHIEKLFTSGAINARERALLITSLLYAMDKIANTCGHYDAYIKGGPLDKKIELAMPVASNNNNNNNQCFNEDANELVKHIEADLVYIDPPYNSRQYCDAYHLLENVARWGKPEVRGVALKMDRSNLKSDYCTQNATHAFEDLIRHTKARYILLSYNNMASKGNGRSNAKIDDQDIMRILSTKGKVKVFSENYKPFSAGKSDIQDNKERLFLCECYDYGKKELIQSPLNYIGGKYKLLPQILPHFPKKIDKFIDLFCGGANVGINVNCNKVVFNDNNPLLRSMFCTLKNLDKDVTFNMIEQIILKYGLSDSSKNGYDYYDCNSLDGLGSYNSEHYLKLRNDFNHNSLPEFNYYIVLYVLILYSFNNQIRFNSKGEFNLPVGKRDFNNRMRNKLSVFIDRLKSGDYTFESKDFRELNTDDWDENTLVYVDPPYLITCATYNEQGGWNETLEKALLDYLDNLNERHIRFALSNVLQSKGKENSLLIKWVNKNISKYRIIYFDYSYANSNYQTTHKESKTEEVLIVNY